MLNSSCLHEVNDRFCLVVMNSQASKRSFPGTYAIPCMAVALARCHYPRVLSGPTDDRIRELCAKVLVARDGEVEQLISELKAALREHTELLRELSRATLARLEER
jgi:hypothetical protein